MSRFIRAYDMSTDQVVQCGYEAMAIVALCEIAAREGAEVLGRTVSGDIAIALKLTGELIAVVHDTVEIHEELIKAASHECAS